MALSEFSLIDRFFRAPRMSAADSSVNLGIGDDAALVTVPPGHQLVVCADTLVQGVHFLETIAARDLGYRALAVNLSDIAAMAAEPRWYTLCLTMPELDERWLHQFCLGLVDAAAGGGLSLIGGDTTAGPLAVSLQLLGLVEPGQCVTRSGAQPGDWVYVTGSLGDAAAGLAQLRMAAVASKQGAASPRSAHQQYLIDRFHRPSPRVAEGALLRGKASSCIDISDGLLADLGHICTQSAVGARIEASSLPLSPALRALAPAEALAYALTGGDDYELCFTVPPDRRRQLETLLAAEGCRFACIGTMVDGSGVVCVDQHGVPIEGQPAGYEHFRPR